MAIDRPCRASTENTRLDLGRERPYNHLGGYGELNGIGNSIINCNGKAVEFVEYMEGRVSN